jgi:glycosyltransferase involved in cell wall biosynthesis
MRLAYANARYRAESAAGGHAHIHQFVKNAIGLGHEVWMWNYRPHPDARLIPSSLWPQFSTLRQMHAIYIRIEATLPTNGPARWAISPYRHLIGRPLVVWEFNTCPEYARLQGRTDGDIQREVENFRAHAAECDLAVCVSNKLAEYAREKLGLKNVLVAPNGSDPELFRPDAAPVRCVQRRDDILNVVWIGSADLQWQNFDLLREAARLLWADRHGARINFHILGQGLKCLRDMTPNVRYYGAERYEALPHWLSAMHVGLCLYQPGPSDYGSPLKLYDYMASGLAVVGTPQPQVQEIFEQLNQTDWLVPHDDPQQLAALLRQLATNRDRIRAQGQAGRKLIVDRFNWRRTVSNTMQAIESLRQADR